ncbi:MAG: hypothetical protein LBJ44_11500 [Propionibacteriaceae bacterium]|nr:hypothetical protein [Propionibacteriaceae bacterium]
MSTNRALARLALFICISTLAGCSSAGSGIDGDPSAPPAAERTSEVATDQPASDATLTAAGYFNLLEGIKDALDSDEFRLNKVVGDGDSAWHLFSCTAYDANAGDHFASAYVELEAEEWHRDAPAGTKVPLHTPRVTVSVFMRDDAATAVYAAGPCGALAGDTPPALLAEGSVSLSAWTWETVDDDTISTIRAKSGNVIFDIDSVKPDDLGRWQQFLLDQAPALIMSAAARPDFFSEPWPVREVTRCGRLLDMVMTAFDQDRPPISAEVVEEGGALEYRVGVPKEGDSGAYSVASGACS